MRARTYRQTGCRGILAALAMLSLAAPATSRDTPPIASRESVRAGIVHDIEAEIAAGRLTGVSFALVSHGRIVWEQGLGWADREARRPATPATPFSLASTTKTFTTAALMTLVRAGRLNLDAPANRFLAPDALTDDRGPANGATLRRLASHSSGAPTFFLMYPEGGGVAQPSVSAVLRDYGHLVAPPGERYEYSNLGMAVIAEIVARRSGQQFGDYLRDHLLVPLGMKNSFFDTDVSRRGEMAVRYDDAGNRMPFYLTATPGSGEMYASAHDLALWAMFHLKDSPRRAAPLDGASLDLLHKPVTRIDRSDSYAMGWMVRNTPDGPILNHGGGQSGVKAEFVLIPGHDVGVAVLSNRHTDQPFVEGIRDRLIRTILPAWGGLAPINTPTLPLPAANIGLWRGALTAQHRAIPVCLRILGPKSATLSIGNRPVQPVTDLGLSDGALSGDAKAEVDAPDARREGIHQVSLNLRRRGEVIDGETIAWFKDGSRMAVLPYWTRLTRQRRADRQDATGCEVGRPAGAAGASIKRNR